MPGLGGTATLGEIASKSNAMKYILATDVINAD